MYQSETKTKNWANAFKPGDFSFKIWIWLFLGKKTNLKPLGLTSQMTTICWTECKAQLGREHILHSAVDSANFSCPHNKGASSHLLSCLYHHFSQTFSSVQFSHSIMSNSLQPHESQHARPRCPLPTPGVHPNSCPSSQWCHLTISSSIVPFASCPQSFPASGSFPMSRFFSLGGQSIGASASASVLPMNIQDWFPLGLTGWISLQSEGLSRVFSSTTVRKHQFFGT